MAPSDLTFNESHMMETKHLRAQLTGMLKGMLMSGLHHNILRSIAKNFKLSTESCTVLRILLTHGGSRLVHF